MKKILIALLVLGITVGISSIGFTAEVDTSTVVETTQASIQNVLQGTLIDIINGVVSAKDFLLEQTPDVLRQLLLWKMLESLIPFILGIFICIIMTVYWWYYVSKFDCLTESQAFGLGLGGITGTLILTLSTTACYSLTWLQIWIAPKIYLIEYAAELIK